MIGLFSSRFTSIISASTVFPPMDSLIFFVLGSDFIGLGMIGNTEWNTNSNNLFLSTPAGIPVYRIAGLNQINNWLSRGLPLPTDVLDIISNTNP